jgi:hypothetical protein
VLENGGVDADKKERFIRRKGLELRQHPDGDHTRWSRHAIAELVEEHWTRGDVEGGLQTCEVIENYPALHRTLPDCLVLGRLGPGAPFHAVIAIDEVNDRVFFVTVYQPSPEEWEDDLRTRRK